MCMDFSLENVVTEFIDQLWNSNGLWHYVVILFLGHGYQIKTKFIIWDYSITSYRNSKDI